MPHVVLLGDSIFDNARYTKGGPDVVSQVRTLLPQGWDASLLAVDGSTTDNTADQMQRLPREATHLALSVGGNDAIMHAPELGIPLFGFSGTTTASALETLAHTCENFETQYRSAVAACLRPNLPLSVCTIYNGCFPDKAYQRIASRALALFNDVIFRVAIEYDLPVIELRLLCANPEDYVNVIEPSSVGGEKIAQAIVAVVTKSKAYDRATRIVGNARVPADNEPRDDS